MATALAFVSIISIIGGVVIGLGRNHVDNRIRKDMKDEIKESVEECMAPLVVSIDALVGYRREDISTRDSDRIAINEAVNRIVGLESTINNGLTSATEKTASDVDTMKVQLAEMYGWMKATHANTPATWDGTIERRE